MKRIFTTLCLAGQVLTSWAQYTGDGYYRLKNFMTERYAYITDSHGSIDYTGMTADMAAVELWKDLNRAIPDPASIIYIKNVGNNNYDIQGQGIGLYSIIGYTLQLSQNSDGTYYAYAEYSGVRLYIGDNETTSVADGAMSSIAKGDYRKWNILPLSTEGDNYFGIQPEFQLGDKYYTTMYASFPFSCASSGMKVYTVTQTEGNQAVYNEITGIVPGGTPVVIECSSNDPTNNRLNIIDTNIAAPADNLLSGVYFFTKYTRPAAPHYNRTAYDPNTMRLLGTLTDGSLGFVKSTTTSWLPANKAYLNVPADAPDEIRWVAASEFVSAIETVKGDVAPKGGDIFNLSGVCVRRQATTTEGLPSGVYIQGGRKIVIE